MGAGDPGRLGRGREGPELQVLPRVCPRPVALCDPPPCNALPELAPKAGAVLRFGDHLGGGLGGGHTLAPTISVCPEIPPVHAPCCTELRLSMFCSVSREEVAETTGQGFLLPTSDSRAVHSPGGMQVFLQGPGRDASDLPGCGGVLFQGRGPAAGPPTKSTLSGCDAGKLWERGLAGIPGP